MLENKAYTASIKVQQEIEEYEERNNPILSFIKDCEEEEIAIINEPVGEVFERYQGYCIRNEYKPLAKNEFSKQLQRTLNLTVKRIGKSKITTFLPLE
ncbi:Poxvirus D5 protein-like protein [compost metagenome]